MKTSRVINPLIAAGLAALSMEAGAYDSNTNPFEIKPLSSGYHLAAEEGKCGDKKSKQGSCGEGKCGGSKDNMEAVCGIYQMGGRHLDESKVKDGKCAGHKVMESMCGGG